MRALFSVPFHEEVLSFAKSLIALGWEIIPTPNLCGHFNKAGIGYTDLNEFVSVTEQFPFPPTLHPRMERALTTECPEKIDLVYNITYDLCVGNDVGGHTLIGLAVKGGRAIACSVESMSSLLKALQTTGAIPAELLNRLTATAVNKIAEHYLCVGRALENTAVEGVSAIRAYNLPNGENPYQVPAALYATATEDALALHNFRSLGQDHGCFTNLADTDTVLHVFCLAACSFQKNFGKTPHIAIAAKHGNPCGMGVDWESPERALEKALFGDPKAIWGGECLVNFDIDAKRAKLLLESDRRQREHGSASWMLDVVAAPSFTDESVEMLRPRAFRRILENDALRAPTLNTNVRHLRQVRGGFLAQPHADYLLEFESNECSDNLSQEDLATMIIAWAVSFGSFHGGNEVALAKNMALLSAGGGPSTDSAAKVAIDRATSNRHDPDGSLFCADAFFPFTDVPRQLCEAGCKGGVVPGGGMNFQLVKEFFSDNSVVMKYLPPEVRGFYRH
jgi:phosphoribosylaminoimidazolecarboxamide formyltransferase/IMP cyclohydrolase